MNSSCQLPADGLEQLRFYRQHWKLVEDAAPFHTPTSYLHAVQQVKASGAPAMLKITMVNEEYPGAQLMVWWEGTLNRFIPLKDFPH